MVVEIDTDALAEFTDEMIATLDDELHPAVARIDVAELADDLEYGGGLRKSKPEKLSGLHQYVWRHAALHAGYETSIPVMADSWLRPWLVEQPEDLPPNRYDHEEAYDAGTKVVKTQLDRVVVSGVLHALGESQTAGAKRWQKAGVLS